MNDTVTDFYSKPSTPGYADAYERDHGPRLDAMIRKFSLSDLKNKSILDVGGGYGFLGKRLDNSNRYAVIDGALLEPKKKLCNGQWFQHDLDHDVFSSKNYDVAFCLETLEHLSNPYHCLCEIKKAAKVGGDIFLSIPTETVWHNVVYPALLWPTGNFVQFLNQMALPVVEFWTYTPESIGWPAYHFKCKNAGWHEKKMLFEKHEEKFIHATPLECTNL